MRLRRAAVLLLAAAAAAQEPPPAPVDLAHLRAVFERWPADSRALLIAAVDGGEPVILCRGDDTHGEPVRTNSYAPVGSLVRLLVADALHCKLGGKLDVPAGVVVAGTRPTILDLLQGSGPETDRLPDYWDWREDAEPVTAATLLACADVAADAGFVSGRGNSSMADLVLLEHLALASAGDDWSSFLRVALAPRVSGLDPRAPGNSGDEAWAAASILSDVSAHAEPAPLRLMVTGKDLANWWAWRLRTSMPLWQGSCMGSRGHAPRRDEVETWTFEDFGNRPVRTLAVAWPQRRAGILCLSVGEPKWIPGQDRSLTDAFEADLFGGLEPQAQLGLGGRFGGRGNNRPLAGWAGQTWVAAENALPCELRIDNATHKGLSLDLGGQTFASVQALREGKAMRVVLTIDNARGGVLWMVTPTEATRKRLVAVFVERSARSTVPHLFRLVPKGDR